MVGNDVVDLEDSETVSGATHPRFDERVFADEEIACLRRSGAPERLRWVASLAGVGKPVTLRVVRGGRTFDLKVTLVELPNEAAAPPDDAP